MLLTTQSASLSDRSASSNSKWFDPLTKTETVLFWFGTPVMFITLEPSDKVTSSAISADPNFSEVN